MESFVGAIAFWAALASLAFYIVLVWVLIRFIRAIEKIADNLWAIARTHARSAEAIEKVASKIEEIPDNENIGK